MNSKPRKIIFLLSRLMLVLAAVFSGVNIFFGLCSMNRLMPMAFSMTGYLTRYGVQVTEEQSSPFFAVYCAAMAGVVCVVFSLCIMLASKNTGWLTAAGMIFALDCIGIAVLIAANGYRSGYWFEFAGHGVMLAAFLTAFLSAPRRKKAEAQ